MSAYIEPVALLFCVNGQPGPDGDYIRLLGEEGCDPWLAPFGYLPGGVTPLDEDTLDDLIERGYCVA